MKTSDVAKLSPVERFLYWIRERHAIYLRRKNGKPKPWTDDEVMQRYFFTNPYRENDRVTVWFRENIREPLRNDPEVFFATVAFRWFNLPEPTGAALSRGKVNAHTNFAGGRRGELMRSLITRWDPAEVKRLLATIRDVDGQTLFTGAYRINSPGGMRKMEAIVDRIDKVWEERKQFTEVAWTPDVTMERFHSGLMACEGMGGFMAYEVVSDLRYTYLLENAPDKDTWANPGPGCVRGLRRVMELDHEDPKKPPLWQAKMVELLWTMRQALSFMPHFEMREVEHSLCEFDKYERLRLGQGRSKRVYPGV